MKRLLLPAMLVALAAGPAYAQFGLPKGVTKGIETGTKVKEAGEAYKITADEERTIGEGVSEKLRGRFGVVQDPAIHKYVTLVGTAVAEGAPADQQPKKGWVFIVLDTDGVNAFAAPGGLVHITRGALAMIKNESELASVLGHEIGHVTLKHTVKAIQKSGLVKTGADLTGANRNAFVGQALNFAYDQVLEGTFDRGDEIESDQVSTQLAPKAGYASTLDDFLKRLDERNKGVTTRNALFASHPATQERIEKLQKLDASIKTNALAEARYKSSVHYELAPVTSIATVPDGAAGLTGGKDAKTDDKNAKKEEPKKGNALTGALTGGNTVKASGGTEKQSASVTSSGGSRGVGADRDAKGGPNPGLVRVSVTAAEVAAFKKAIA